MTDQFAMRLPALSLAALLIVLAGNASAQAIDSATTDPAQLTSRWQTANATCRSPTATAVAAVGACEQRDTLSKVLAQMNYCYGPADKAGPATWAACGAKALQESVQARTTAQFQRMGGVFVMPAVINGGTKSYFIVDSGAANVQIPEEVAEEMKRAGTLAESDFLGQRRFTLADGRRGPHRTVVASNVGGMAWRHVKELTPADAGWPAVSRPGC